MKSKILVLGYFGYETNQLDGQTIKTRNVYDLIKSKEEQIGNVTYFDTELFQKSKFSVFTLLWKLVKSNQLIYLPAQNNLKIIFPVIYFLSVVFKLKIHYFVVGGWLSEFIANKQLHRFMLKRIAGIHTETIRLKNELEQNYHFNNVDVFPNFRFFDYCPTIHHKPNILNLVFMARVNKMKGLDMIFSLGDYIHKNGQEKSIHITFYGPIFTEDRLYFETELAKYPFMKYNGELQPALINETLQQYDAMLLPTHYYTEGLPGSIVDAYISGIPVIVTNWKHAEEFVSHGITGFIVPFENGEKDFINYVMCLYNDSDTLRKMKLYAYERSKEFSAEAAWIILKKYLLK